MTVTTHRRRTVTSAVCLAVLVSGCGYRVTVNDGSRGSDAAAQQGKPADLSAAQSNPVEDSYYPQRGEPYLDTLHYDLKLDWSPKERTLTGTATITFRVTEDREEVQFDLGDPLEVSKASVDGRAVTATRGTDTVVVKTGRLAKDSRHEVVLEYAGTPKTTPAPSQRGDQGGGLGFTIEPDGQTWTMQEPFGAFTWYPVNDQPADKAFYNATLISRDGQKGVFNGIPGPEKVDGDTTTRSFRLDQPAASYLTTVAFGKYSLLQETGPRNLPMYYWYDPSSSDAAMFRRGLQKSPDTLKYLETLLGPYPFASAGAVLVPSDSAMETQTMVTMGVDSTRSPDDFDAVMAHEYAHQWVGDVVTPKDWKDLFLNESLAMFLQAKYEDHAKITPYAVTMSSYRALDARLRREDGPPGKFKKDHFAASNVYLCGALMYDAMASAYGQKFYDALKSWPTVNKFGNVDRDDLMKHFSDKIGVDLKPWMTNWLESETTPTDQPPALPSSA
ncbi:M1 family metallopeptidase [Yimella sp. cx-573]|nr:M1 family metallopeptidase [Yimella sp. cx-573]